MQLCTFLILWSQEHPIEVGVNTHDPQSDNLKNHNM
jgi:hypothetical protein